MPRLSARVSIHLIGRRRCSASVGDHRVLRIEAGLDAEAAADLRRNHADERLRQAGERDELLAHAVRILRRGRDDQPAVQRIGLGEDRARLHRHRRDPLIDHPLLDDDVRRREGRRRVAMRVPPGESDIPRRFVVELRRVRRERGFRVHDGRERLVLHIDEIERVARDVAIHRDDNRHRLADIADAIRRHRPDRSAGTNPFMPGTASPSRPGSGPQSARNCRAAVGRDHAGMRQRGGDVHPHDPRVGIDAPQDRHVRGARRAQIVHVRGTAGDEARIFLPLDPRTDLTAVNHAFPSFHHGQRGAACRVISLPPECDWERL